MTNATPVLTKHDAIEGRIENAARIVHEAHRAYCITLNDFTQVPWDEAPAWQKEALLASVRERLNNPTMSPELVHDHWCELKRADGWRYGPVKDAERKTHPYLVPHSKLPASQQRKDYLSGAIILALTHPILTLPEADE